jgi:hypothetical protein
LWTDTGDHRSDYVSERWIGDGQSALDGRLRPRSL